MSAKMPSNTCIMCKQNIEDRIQFGEKITFEDVTAHYFCLLLSSNLEQNGEDDEGILGFMPIDIKKEAKRAKFQKCMFCRKSGANISCCDKKCRRVFHFTCGSQADCHFEFIDLFKSYCGRHINFEMPQEYHQSTDLCIICFDQMGEYSAVKSIRTPCCKSNWCHRLCLQKYADNAGHYCKCPGCNDTKQFRAHLAKHGVFIPERDAKWEETDMNSFYEFEQHIERPNECIAKNCKMNEYLKQNDDEENELLLCEYCGSKGIHELCLEKCGQFICDDCKPPSSKRRKLLNSSYESLDFNELNGSTNSIADSEDINNNNNNTKINDSVQKETLKNMHKLAYDQFPHFKPIKLTLKLPNFPNTHSKDINSNTTNNKRKRSDEI